MKERLTRNIGLKILSLLLAGLLWVVILNVDDPVKSETFTDIAVTKINENVLKSKDKVYEVVSGETINVKVKGKRSIIESLKNSDFQVIADLSQLSIVDAVPINVSVPKYGDEIEIVDRDKFSMKVSLENFNTQQFRIDVVEKGTVAEGYYIKEKTARPNIIQVSGAESVVGKIREVDVEIDVWNASESFTEKAVPKVYDNNGTLMDSSKMTFNYEEVDVSVDLLKTKTVKLYIELKGTPFYGYEYVNFEYEPKEVVIAGEQEELDKVQYIKGEYNIDNKREDIVDEVNIKDFIKEDVILIDENQNAVINIDIEKLAIKEISFGINEIEIRNLPDVMVANITNNGIISTNVYGNLDKLKTVTKTTIKPYIDLADAQIGTKLVNIQFDTSESEITISNPSISVSISEADEKLE
jgi:YbbR domain-containing protein